MKLATSTFAASLLLASIAPTAIAHAEGPTADACATASDNAQPLRKSGKLRAAKQQLLLCVNHSCPSIVRDDCAAQLSGVEKTLPTIVFAATDSQGGDLDAVVVTMDGQRIADHLDGTALAVDPGQHEFRFESSGLPAVVKKLVVREAEKDRRVEVSFSAPHTGSSSTAAGKGDSPAETGAAKESPSLWPVYVAYGIGTVGLVVGVIFTVSALSQNSTLSGECASNGGCDPKYQPQIDDLHQDQILLGVGYGVAGVGAAVGTYLLLTSGPTTTHEAQTSGALVRVEPRFGLGWLGFEGRF